MTAGFPVAHDAMATDSTAEANRTSAEMTALIHAISHEIRAPIRAIEVTATWLDDDTKALCQLSDEQREQVRSIRDRARRVDKALVGLLDYSRLEREPRRLSSVDTRALVEEVCTDVAARKSLTIQCNGQFPTLTAPRERLRRVLSNLVENAVVHQPAACPHVRVLAESSANSLSLTIEDDGPGIAPALRHHVFHLLYATGPFAGIGMGLPVAKKLIELEGGRLTLIPRAHGTAMHCEWPLPYRASESDPGDGRGDARP